MFLAPIIHDEVCLNFATQARAKWARLHPNSSWAIFWTYSKGSLILSKSTSWSILCFTPYVGSPPVFVPSSNRDPAGFYLMYFPVKTPPRRGLKATNPYLYF